MKNDKVHIHQTMYANLGSSLHISVMKSVERIVRSSVVHGVWNQVDIARGFRVGIREHLKNSVNSK